MNCKKYRICLMLLVLALLAGTAFYYMFYIRAALELHNELIIQKGISEESRTYA